MALPIATSAAMAGRHYLPGWYERVLAGASVPPALTGRFESAYR